MSTKFDAGGGEGRVVFIVGDVLISRIAVDSRIPIMPEQSTSRVCTDQAGIAYTSRAKHREVFGKSCEGRVASY